MYLINSLGISITELTILQTITEDISYTEIAKLTDISYSYVFMKVTALTRKGLVSVVVKDNNKRRVSIGLTEKGLRIKVLLSKMMEELGR